jgi:recombination protein RecA
MFGEGISRAGEIIDLGVEYDVINKSGSWFSYNGTKLAQGRDAAKRAIQDNPELADELEEKIMQALKEADKSPMARRAKAAATATETEAAPAAEPAKDFDDELPDDFSIEEDL